MVIIIIMVIIMIIITVIMVGKVRGGEVREGELGSKTWREGGSSNNIIINSTQKVRSRVLNSRNMMSVARTSYSSHQRPVIKKPAPENLFFLQIKKISGAGF